MNPTLLAIDTSTEACSAALLCAGQVCSRFEVKPRAHNRLILTMIRDLCADANIELSALQAIAFGQGPGSFTGIRMAAGIVQGIAFGANIPVIPISTLQLLAQTAYDKHGFTSVAVAMDARLNEYYFNLFTLDEHELMQPLGEDCITNLNALRLPGGHDWHAVGDAWLLDSTQYLADQLARFNKKSLLIHPNATSLIALATPKIERGEMLPPEKALPRYLRGSGGWKKQTVL